MPSISCARARGRSSRPRRPRREALPVARRPRRRRVDCPRDGRRHLEVAEVVGRVEAVERAVAELVQVEVVALLRRRRGCRGRTRPALATRRRRSRRCPGRRRAPRAGRARPSSGSACRRATVGPNIPRRATRMPVALATIACSNEILVPSANDVTIVGFCPHCRAKPSWVVGLRYGSWRPLMLPHSTGRTPMPRTKR